MKSAGMWKINRKGSDMMPNLICAKDVESLHAQGKQTIYISSKTIITPAARDAAESKNMQFAEESETDLFSGIDSEKLTKIMKIMLDRGMLSDLLKPYEAECHTCGFKVIRGKTVQLETLETGQQAKAFYQEVAGDGAVHTGFLTIEDSRFDWTIECEEHNYIIEGCVTVIIDGKSFTAYAGDVLYFPKGTKVVWETDSKVKIFYATHPE